MSRFQMTKERAQSIFNTSVRPQIEKMFPGNPGAVEHAWKAYLEGLRESDEISILHEMNWDMPEAIEP